MSECQRSKDKSKILHCGKPFLFDQVVRKSLKCCDRDSQGDSTGLQCAGRSLS